MIAAAASVAAKRRRFMARFPVGSSAGPGPTAGPHLVRHRRMPHSLPICQQSLLRKDRSMMAGRGTLGTTEPMVPDPTTRLRSIKINTNAQQVGGGKVERDAISLDAQLRPGGIVSVEQECANWIANAAQRGTSAMNARCLQHICDERPARSAGQLIGAYGRQQ